MATSILANITARGTKADFVDAMDIAPNVWEKHTKQIQSDAPDERYTWLGQLPIPRLFTSERNIQGLRDFTFTVANQEYEMTFIVDQKTVEDDRHGTVQARIKEVAEVYATFKDSLFATLVTVGETSTETFDGTSFHSGSRTIGQSGTIDNTSTQDISVVAAPTVAELKAGFKTMIDLMWRYKNDQGQAAYNAKAMMRLSAIIPPEYHQAFTELINSSLISNSDNPWAKGIAEFDVLPSLPAVTGSDAAWFLSAIGAERMPFIFQQRVPLQVEVFNSPHEIADARGLKILTRERFRFAYGEPRRNHRIDYT